MRAARLLPAAAVVLLAGLGSPSVAATERPAVPASAPPGVQPPGLPSHLPLRRDPAAAGPEAAWSPWFALLSAVGAAGGWWWWRRTGGRAPARRPIARSGDAAVVRMASQALTAQASVHAVRWRGEEYLLGCTAQQVSLLSRRPLPGEGE